MKIEEVHDNCRETVCKSKEVIKGTSNCIGLVSFCG